MLLNNNGPNYDPLVDSKYNSHLSAYVFFILFFFFLVHL